MTAGRDRLDRVVVGLSATQLVSWGVLYYSLPVLVADIDADTGWGGLAVMGAFSTALLVAAIMGIPIGRAIDRFGPRTVMTAGSVLAAVGVGVVALAPTWIVFALGWVVIGVAQAAVLYPPAFTVVGVHYAPPARDRALLIVTIVGGLASTAFVPIAAVLGPLLGWRWTFAVLGAVLLVVTVTIHATTLPRRRAEAAPQPRGRGRGRAGRGRDPVIGSARFVLLAIGLTLIATSLYAITVNLIPLLSERGQPASVGAAAFAAIGIGQVLGRIVFTLGARRIPARFAPALVGGLAAIALVLLALVPGPWPLLVAVAALSGTARGSLTLVQATAVVERWGGERLGARNGLLQAPSTAAVALAPVGGIAAASLTGSFQAAALIAVGLAVVGAGLSVVAERVGRRRSSKAPAVADQRSPMARR